MMKNVLLIAVLFFSLLSGCIRSEEKKTPVVPTPVPAVIEHSNKLESDQVPYYDGLIEEFRTTLAEDPNNFAALVGLGNAYFDSGQWKKAVVMYEHALAINPRNADVRTDMGTAYRNLGMPDRALAEYRAVLVEEPGHLNARYNMGIVFAHDKKNYQAAIHIWKELLKLSPNFPYADHIRASIAALEKRNVKESR